MTLLAAIYMLGMFVGKLLGKSQELEMIPPNQNTKYTMVSIVYFDPLSNFIQQLLRMFS
jgi:hypothetical protein